jgi:hypothetical protein
VVAFNGGASVLGAGPPRHLQRATDANVDAVVRSVLGVSATGTTSFTSAFTTAFDVLQRSISDHTAAEPKTSECTRVVLFLTDGVSDESQSSLLSQIDAAQSGLSGTRAHIFAYSMGSGADTTKPRAIACANEGLWASVGDDPLAEMSQYFEFLATGVAQNAVRWTAPYVDAFGLGWMVTAAIAVYDRSGTTPRLVGVTGADVPLHGDSTAIAAVAVELASMGGTCTAVSLSQCQMQLLRRRTGYTCPSPAPIVQDCLAAETLEAPTACDTSTLPTMSDALCEGVDSRTRLSAGSAASGLASYRDVACCGTCAGNISGAVIVAPERPACAAAAGVGSLAALVALASWLL